MRLLRIIDENGFFIEEQFSKEITDNMIETLCPQGFIKPKWSGEEWVEGITQKEIDDLENRPKEPSELEILKQEKEILAQSVYEMAEIIELILMGGIE